MSETNDAVTTPGPVDSGTADSTLSGAAATLPVQADERSRQPVSVVPSLRDASKNPAIVLVCLTSIAVTLAWWAKVDISPLLGTVEVQRGEVWRLVTDVFPHADIMHLVFNLYWIWIFGTIVEGRLGHAKTFLLVLLFAWGSSAAQFALAGEGVGLSGVGYGFFGLLWMLSKKDERFRGTMLPSTVNLFLGWFLLCVVLTLAKVWNVGNVAHGAGAVLGVLTGLAIAEPAKRVMWATCVAALMVASLWGATAGRSKVNFTSAYGYDEARLGFDALRAGKNIEAVRWLSDAAVRLPNEAGIAYYLGAAYDAVGQTANADAAFQTAYRLKPGDPDIAAAARQHSLNLLKQRGQGAEPSQTPQPAASDKP